MTALHTRRGLFHTTALAGALAVCLAATGAHAQERAYNIPAQSLAESLRQYGLASGEQIIFAERMVSGRQAPALQGSYDADYALKLLLADSGLTATRTTTGGIMIVSASDPQSGSAAGDGADQGTVQALIVTAQKREENIQDVPIAMSAFTQEDLTRSQVAGGPDLMTQIPNFTFTKTNFTSYSIQIRGIGTQAISATTDAAVAVAFNNTPFIRNRFFEQEFYDLQRVEVLRGPQGTLYGRNATAGVVNIISQKPNLGNFEAKVSADVANYNSTRLEGMVNLPLAEDIAALRIAGAWTKREGYSTNELTGNPIDGRNLWSTRVSLRVEPNDRFSANLIWEHFEEDDDRLRSAKQLCKKDHKSDINGALYDFAFTETSFDDPRAIYTQGCVPASIYSSDAFQTPEGPSLPYYVPLEGLGLPVTTEDPYVNGVQSRDLRVIESTWDPEYKAKSDIGELQLAFDITEQLTLSSETSYGRDFVWSIEDFNRFSTKPGLFGDYWFGGEPAGLLDENGVFCDPQLGCSSRLLAVDLSTAKSRQFSQEFRLASDFEGRFNFSLGANFLRYDTEDKYYVFFNSTTLTAAYAYFNQGGSVLEWVPGQTDNRGCLKRGLLPADPALPQDIAGCVYIDPNPIGSLNDEGHNYFLSKNPYKLLSYAVFGESYFQISPTLKLTAGLRWTVDKKEAPRIPSWLLSVNSVGYPVDEVVRQEWKEPTGRLTLDWKPDLAFTDETLVYASLAHGYKAGGANPPPTALITYCVGCYVGGNIDYITPLKESMTHPATFEPEFVNALEIGAKNTLLDGSLTLNLASFYYDYKGYQISEIVDRSAVNHNYDAEVWGLEVEADWRPLENLRLGFKGGYEESRIANGMQAIDLMDRTAGHTDWVVAKPFATIPSNCILPVDVATHNGHVVVQQAGVPSLGPCMYAYQIGLDPITLMPYVPDPQWQYFEGYPLDPVFAGYAGFDPKTAPNNGEGFAKDLGGNQLPNAPRFTATITADYTIPLPHDWLATVHTDLYYQSEAWTRIFNMEGYDKLKAFSNINLAAIFSNEDAGWQVIAYVKNVLDKDNITGAFLNSDDTGLTTNVFLNEPRLYGLRVTKNWSGAPWWLVAGHKGPHPLTVELGGEAQRHDAPYAPVKPSFNDSFDPAIAPVNAQNRDLDWGEGGEVKVTYSPSGSWGLSGSVRWGRANGTDKPLLRQTGAGACAVIPDPSSYFGKRCFYESAKINGLVKYPTNYTHNTVANAQEFVVADFFVGQDVGLGMGAKSHVSAGLRYADLKDTSHVETLGRPDFELSDGWFFDIPVIHQYELSSDAARTFKGAGPEVAWDVSRGLLAFGEAGELRLDASASAGILFGKQKVDISGEERGAYGKYIGMAAVRYNGATPLPTVPIDVHRSKSATVPVLDLSLGLDYGVERFKVGAGYRWERYFDAIDGGFEEHQSSDRTIDGPYFKVSMGFGG